METINNNLIHEINQALSRMKKKNKGIGCLTGINYYDRLKEKRDLILQGHEVKIKRNQQLNLIAYVGGQIPTINYSTKRRRIYKEGISYAEAELVAEQFLIDFKS